MEQPWQPANAVEAALSDALDRGDQARYCEVLAQAPLLVSVTEPAGAHPPVLAPVSLDNGATGIPAYTSPEAVARSAVQGGHARHVPTGFAQLAAEWPDPAWLLVVNPGLPVAVNLVGSELPLVAATVYAPVSEAETALAAARTPAAVMDALAGADLYLPVPPELAEDPPKVADPAFPWWCEESGADGVPPVVPVFTSVERLTGCLGLRVPQIGAARTELPVLALAWPDPGWAMAVDPGAPYAVTLVGAQIERLAQRATDVVAGDVELQVLVPGDLIPSYLERGHGTVAGVVHTRPAGPVALAALYRQLGLLRPGSAFAATDELVHVVRWQPAAEAALRWAADPSPRTETAALPAGAQLIELHTSGAERLVATFQPDRARWVAAEPSR